MLFIKDLIDILGSDLDRSNLSNKAVFTIYKIENGIIKDEEDLLNIVFDNYASRKIALIDKSKLKKELTNVLIGQFLGMVNDGEEIKDRLVDVYRMFSAVKILIKQQRRIAAVELAEKIFLASEKLGLTEIILSMSRYLVIHYSSINYNKRKMDKYASAVSRYVPIYTSESSIELSYSIVSSILLRKTSYSDEDILTIKKIIEEIELNKIDSIRYMQVYFNTVTLYLNVIGKCKELISKCEEALLFFRKKKYLPDNYKFTFIANMIPCLIKTGQYDKVESYLKIKVIYGSRNWEVLQHYKYILLGYKGLTYQLPEIVQEIEKVGIELNDNWKILKGLSNIMNGLDANSTNLINESSIGATDKGGLNVLLKVIRVMDLILKDRVDEVFEMLDAIKHYLYTQLNKTNSTDRSKLMLKLILSIKYLNTPKFKEHSGAIYLQLQSTPMNADIDTEPIPFEILWKKILDTLL